MSDLRDKRAGANDPVIGGAELPEGLRRARKGPYSTRPESADEEIRSRKLKITEHSPGNEEEAHIQRKQGDHHLPPNDGDGPALDDTDRNTDKVIKPARRKP